MNTKQPSVCFISPFIGPLLVKGASKGSGGAERQLLLFGDGFVKNNWRVIYVAMKEEGDLISSDFKVYWVDFSFLGGPKWKFIRTLIDLTKVVRKEKADFYIIKHSYLLNPIVLFIHVILRGRFIIWGQMSTDYDRIKGHQSFILSYFRRKAIKEASFILTQTNEQSLSLLLNFNRKALLIPNVTTKSPLRDNLDYHGFVFWCGNTLEHKRPRIFLELAKNNPQLEFVMAVNSSNKLLDDILRREAEAITNLRYLGSIPYDKIDSWFSNAKVYVNTSVREGFPNTFLQAWQQGVPVLSVSVNPDGVITKHNLGFCGYINNDHLQQSELEIAKSMTPLLDELYYNYSSYSTRCIKYVDEHHNAERLTQNLINFIKNEHAK